MCRHHCRLARGVAADRSFAGRPARSAATPDEPTPGRSRPQARALEVVVHRLASRSRQRPDGGAMTLEAWMTWRRCVGIEAERAWARVTYGVHRRAGASTSAEHPPAWAEDDLSGWQLLMTDVGCFTGLTALEVLGVPAASVARSMPCLRRAWPRTTRARCAAGVHTSRHIRPVEHVVVRGLRVATVPEALTAAARWIGVVDMVALIDAAIFLELVTLERAGGDRTDPTAGQPPAARRRCRWWTVAPSPCGSRCSGCSTSCATSRSSRSGSWWTPTACWWPRPISGSSGRHALHEFDGDEHEKAPRRVGDRRRDRRVDQAGIRTPRLHRGRRASIGR